MVAFSNSLGGYLIIGVNDDGQSLWSECRRYITYNQLVSRNASTEHMRPPIAPTTQNFNSSNGMVMLVHIPEGLANLIWIKICTFM